MTPDESVAQLLELSRSEKKVLAALSSEHRAPTDIIKKAKVPRATAYLAFSSLKKRGLAKTAIRDGRRYWLEAETKETQTLLYEMIRALQHTTLNEKVEVAHKADTSITVHKGRESVVQVIKGTIALYRHERFYIFQSAESDDGWSDVIGMKNIIKINRALKARQVIGESFIPENYFSHLTPILGKKWAESYVDRLNIVYFLPKEFFTSKAEILLFRDQVIIFHLKSEIAVEVRNPEILNMFKGLFEMFKVVGRKVTTREEAAPYLQ